MLNSIGITPMLFFFAPLITIRPLHFYDPGFVSTFNHRNMRKRAFILILPLTIFILETVSFVPAMQETCAIIASTETVSCCMPATGNHPAACAGEEEDIPEEPCSENPDCSTCPVCYTFIIQPGFEWKAGHFSIEKKYASLKQDYIFSYSTSVWKPPNEMFHYL
jgi:hypothetical protein